MYSVNNQLASNATTNCVTECESFSLTDKKKITKCQEKAKENLQEDSRCQQGFEHLKEDSNKCDESFAAVYDYYDTKNVHQFASHSSYCPLYRYSTLTLICEIVAENNFKMRCRVLLDNCSNVSIVRRSVADKLQMQGEKTNLDILVTGGGGHTFKRQKKVQFRLASILSTYVTPFVVEACTMPTISQQFDRIDVDPADYEHLKDIEFTEPIPMSEKYYENNKNIDILLGLPYQSLIQTAPFQIEGQLGEPIAHFTKLGNCVSVNNSLQKRTENLTYLCRQCENDIPYLKDWLRLDSIGIEDPTLNNHLTYNELLMDQILDQNTVYIKESKQYKTSLPWVDEPIPITNTSRAAAAASRIAKKYSSDENKFKQMSDSVQSMLDSGFAEIVPKKDLAKKTGFHYINCFPVFSKSSTHKCRMVYQANQIMPEINKSLNDHLITGKNNLPEIPQLLMAFRRHNFCAVTDVSRMFQRFLLHDSCKDYLRFFFAFKRPQCKEERVELVSLRNTTLPYGLSSSPSVATYLLQKHASTFLNGPYDKAARFVISCTYMDDTSYGSETESELKTLTSQIKHIFDTCSLPTHKYFSNSKVALEDLDPKLCSTQSQTSVLGSVWDAEADTLSFNAFQPPPSVKKKEEAEENSVSEENCHFEELDTNLQLQTEDEINATNYTKRMLSSISAQVYDINGFISPFLLKSKLLLQQAWKEKVDWDENLPNDILKPAREWIKQLPHLKDIRFPRRIVPPGGRIIEICILNDACTTGFATCAYVISLDTSGNRHSHLVFSKSKVKPLNKNLDGLSEQLSIPRMEMLSATIGAKVGQYVKEAFKDIPNVRTRYFTDSLVTLYRIHNEETGLYKPWVANRVNTIHSLTDREDWFYCPGDLNFSADAASRGMDLKDFIDDPRWRYGPQFLVATGHVFITADMLKLSQTLKQIDAQERKVVIPTFHATFVSHQVTVVNISELGIEELLNSSNSRSLDFFEGQNKTEPTKNGLLYLRSTWSKTVRILGWIFRFIHACKNLIAMLKRLKSIHDNSENYKHKLRNNRVKRNWCVKAKKTMNFEEIVQANLRLSSEEQTFAEEFLFRYAQFCRFSTEISCIRNGKELDTSNALYRLMPVWSEDKFLRMSGRLPSSNLIILPKDHQVTALYIRHVHTKFNHASVAHTMFQIQNRCHVMGNRQQIKKVLQCCTCRQPIKLYQRMSALPPINYLNQSNHGYYVQIDFAGPFEIVAENGELVKSWSCIFSCLITRLVTVKLLKSCTTRDLILGIQSYIAQRGAWTKAYTDSAKYFRSASDQLKAIIKNIKWSNVKDGVLGLNMDWEFNVPLSPHRTGAIESIVKIVKVGLYKAIRNELLDYLRLSVVFEQISAVVNSRPLGYVASTTKSADQELMISPNVLCYGRNVDVLPTPPVKDNEVKTLNNTSLQKIYNAHSSKLSVFWKSYYDHYFNHLKFTKRWMKKLTFDIKPGTFVLVKEPNLHKFEYKTGRVLNSIKSKDGLVRTLQIKFAKNKQPVLRDIKNCSLLEHDFLKLSNDDHQCSHAYHTCVLSSADLDALLMKKKCPHRCAEFNGPNCITCATGALLKKNE